MCEDISIFVSCDCCQKPFWTTSSPKTIILCESCLGYPMRRKSSISLGKRPSQSKLSFVKRKLDDEKCIYLEKNIQVEEKCDFIEDSTVVDAPVSISLDACYSSIETVSTTSTILLDHIENEDDGDEGIVCLFCGTDISQIDAKDDHILKCSQSSIRSLNENSSFQISNEMITDENDKNVGLNSEIFFCVLCDMDISKRSVLHRCMHMKKCAKLKSVDTKQLLSLLISSDENVEEQEEDVNVSEDDPVVDRSVVDESGLNCSSKTSTVCSEGKNAWTVMMNSSKSLALRELATSLKKTSSNSANANSTAIVNQPKYMKSHRRNMHAGSAPSYKLIRNINMDKPIVVDGFVFAHPELSDCYFLTHFHSDHYQGIDSSFDCGRIYCSPTTCQLVKLRLKVASTFLFPLVLDQIHDIQVGTSHVKVMLSEANHCPGAVCILFLFDNGKKVLHTGDFRWSRELLDLPMYSSLLPSTECRVQKSLIVYLDTTYCDRNYCFPPQQAVIEKVVECVKQESKVRDTLFLFGAYSIGKERVFMAAAMAMNKKVYVDKTRWKAMICYSWPLSMLSLLTTNKNETNIWVVSMNQINFNEISKHQQAGKYTRVVGFLPTGWSHHHGSKSDIDSPLDQIKPRTKGLNKIYSFPYSEHSSFSELVDFMNTFRPNIVIPTVNTREQQVESQLKLLTDSMTLRTDDNKLG